MLLARVRRRASVACRAQFSSSSSAVASAPPAASPSPLELSLARRDVAQALAELERLEAPPATSVLQRLALLTAKQRGVARATRAHELLMNVYRCVPTALSSTYTVSTIV